MSLLANSWIILKLALAMLLLFSSLAVRNGLGTAAVHRRRR